MFRKYKFDCIIDLKLRNCQLTDKLIFILFHGFVNNDSIKFVDLSKNILTQKSYFNLLGLYVAK